MTTLIYDFTEIAYQTAIEIIDVETRNKVSMPSANLVKLFFKIQRCPRNFDLVMKGLCLPHRLHRNDLCANALGEHYGVDYPGHC